MVRMLSSCVDLGGVLTSELVSPCYTAKTTLLSQIYCMLDEEQLLYILSLMDTTVVNALFLAIFTFFYKENNVSSSRI